MKRWQRVLAGALVVAGGTSSWAGGGPSALEALQALQARIGPEACEILVAMHGQRGQDQPEEWMVLALNPQSPNLGQQYVIDRVSVVDEGAPQGMYPAEIPPGFVSRSQVLVDSPYAFRTLHEVAVKAQVGFNAVNYTLMAREYGREPVWRLEALDVNGRAVGQVDLSATSGAVYRTVWYYWEEVDAGAVWRGPRIVDSQLSEVMPSRLPGPGYPGIEAGPGLGTGPGLGPEMVGPVEPAPERARVFEMPRQPEAEGPDRDKGGLFSRLRKGAKPLFGPGPEPEPEPGRVAPEAGRVVPVPPGGTVPTLPTVEVEPAGPR